MPRRPKPPATPKRRRRGSGSIARLADGTIRARLPAAIDPARPAREFRSDQLAEAEAWLESYLHPQAAPEVGPIALGTWADTWWETYVAPIRPPNTARWYAYALRQLASLYGVPLPDVRASALQAVVGALTGRLDAATVQAVVGVWRRCLAAAIEDELIARNPASRLTVPKVAARAVQRFVTPAEVAILRDAIVGHRFEAAYALMLGCGLRIGEVLGLHWQHVDLAQGRAWIEPQYTNGHWRSTPKAANPHWIPLPPFVVASLIRHRNAQAPGAVLVMQSPYDDHGGPRRKRPPDRTGPRPWSRQVVGRDLAKLVAELGLDHLTSHAGRHGLATHLMQAGVSPPVIAKRLGNTPGVVVNTYGHATAEGQQQASDVIDAYLSGPPEDKENPTSRSG